MTQEFNDSFCLDTLEPNSQRTSWLLFSWVGADQRQRGLWKQWHPTQFFPSWVDFLPFKGEVRTPGVAHIESTFSGYIPSFHRVTLKIFALCVQMWRDPAKLFAAPAPVSLQWNIGKKSEIISNLPDGDSPRKCPLPSTWAASLSFRVNQETIWVQLLNSLLTNVYIWQSLGRHSRETKSFLLDYSEYFRRLIFSHL